MNGEQALRSLEELGKEKTQKIYLRHGASGPLYGVSIADLNKLSKQIGKDPELAEALFSSGNDDARLLALRISEPKGMTGEVLDRWVEALDWYMLVDEFTTHVAAKSPMAAEKALAWIESGEEFVSQAGWNLVAHLAMNGKKLPDSWFAPLLDRIRSTLHSAPNRTRHAMNGALIAIGGSRDSLTETALDVAREIGVVEVDHGETGCVTPDAAGYIEKMLARRAKKG